ncbi:Ppx/GppA phosphatase family protein [Arthrobacter roseus]
MAAIDCGTNSIRLLIADADQGALTDVVRLMRVVRLGEGVDATGRFSDAALERTLAATREYAELIEQHDAGRIRFVATSATRDAANREVFFDGVRELLGVEPEVISGDEEASLSFQGAASVLSLDQADNLLVVDLGGGSTEFVMGNADGVTAARSMNMGCVRFTEKFLSTDPPTASEIAMAVGSARELIHSASIDVPLSQATALVGVAGSVTTITAHALGLEEYSSEAIHGTELPQQLTADACTDLLTMPRSVRGELPYMHPGRVDVIGAGALIWRTIIDELAERTNGRIASTITSEHDILDGIALSIASSERR